ncbi:MAG: geranylgeranylglycerol-phosphate geranylgeranyltransferase [Bacteroidia bacterium]
MIAFLKLIRLQNLLIIAFTQYMVRWCIVYPILKAHSNYYNLQLSEIQFFLLVLSTTMIAAAGYVINDYFDVKIDKVNKPDRLVIDNGIKRRVAIGAHTVINFIAIVIAGAVSFSIGSWRLVFIHFICALGLWFYSTTFKRQFFIGNFIIATFTALVPLIVVIYELMPAYRAYGPLEDNLSFKPVWKYALALSFFAFITTLLREIIKDMEDYEGDKEYGCKTIPIVIGIRSSKIVTIVIAITTMILLAYIQLLQWKSDHTIDFYYFLAALQIPFTFLIYKTYTASTKHDFRFAGNTAKFIMLMGVCYLFIFAHFILSQIHAV